LVNVSFGESKFQLKESSTKIGAQNGEIDGSKNDSKPNIRSYCL